MTTRSAVPLNKWLVSLARPAQARVSLILFPFAGAGPSAFNGWSDGFPRTVELLAVQLPGREARFKEPLILEIAEIVDALVPSLLVHLARDTVFFGHSMGALLAFETARKLREQGFLPRHLHVSGCPGPGLNHRLPRLLALPREQFVEEMRKLSGTPHEVLDSEEMHAIVLPALRADLGAVQSYLFVPGEPLGCPIYAYGGDSDPWTSRAELEAWKEQTSSLFLLTIFSGDHFYFRRETNPLVPELRRRILSL